MNLLENYIKICSDTEAFNKYYKCGQDSYGEMFAFKNTNFRYMKSFMSQFEVFKKVDGINRTEWSVNPNYNQQNDKTRTVRMFGSKLFSKNQNIYYKTQKGDVMDKMIVEDFQEEEKFLLVFLLIADLYFNNTKNYIFEKSKYVFENLLANGISEKDIISSIITIIKGNPDKNSLSTFNFLFFDTFYTPFKNYDFISSYVNSSEQEKIELVNYITENLVKKANNCIISQKYQGGGNYDIPMLIEDAKLLYLSNIITNMTNVSFSDFIKIIVSKYNEIIPIDYGKVFQFIFSNKDVFEIIYFNIFDIDYLGIEDNSDSAFNTFGSEDLEDSDTEKIDDTTTNNSSKLKRITTVLKRKAKERSNYTCELEKLCGCDNFYFTSKETNKNYLEIHHFIPREFSNDFEKNIEVIENYICLCPRCHRMIHLAVDRERKTLISYIYNERVDKLKNVGLDIKLKDIENYYRIDD